MNSWTYHNHEKPVLQLGESLDDLLPVELVGDDTLLVSLQTVNSLEAIFRRKIASFSRAVMCPPVGDESDADSQETKKEVNHLVTVECGGVNATKAIDDGGTDESAQAVTAVPACNTERLF